MSLCLIATPIGNSEEITLRALNALKTSPIIIGEEARTLRRRLSTWEISPQEKTIYELNEHSSEEDLRKLLKVCMQDDVCLVSDCGTPSFFDPGFQLVELCKKNGVSILSLPGVSSLTALIPFLDRKTENFTVLGFPPQKQTERLSFFSDLKKMTAPFLIMDTPYRLHKIFDELEKTNSKFYCVLGINLTCENELIAYGTPPAIKKQISHLKKENFVCMVYPNII